MAAVAVVGVLAVSMLPKALAQDEAGLWVATCQEDSTAGEACVVQQTLMAEGSEGHLLQVRVIRLGRAETPILQFVLPLGILLPSGMVYQIDEAPEVNLPILSCTVAGCVARTEADAATLGSLKRGRILRVGFRVEDVENVLAVEVSLEGVTSALVSVGM